MDEDLYDEFGNYIGPQLADSDEEEFEAADLVEDEARYEDHAMVAREAEGEVEMEEEEQRIVLHEHKKYYPEAEEVFPGVRTVVLDEDAQPLEVPIIQPIKTKCFSVLEKEVPRLNYSTEFMAVLMNNPQLIRNVAVIGQLHHGKTCFVDTLVETTHEQPWAPHKLVRYTDSRKDEQERELSIKATPISLVLESLRSKSYVINVLDCPGHVNFSDEVTAALRAVDAVVLVVDAVEGVMSNTERLLKHALQENLPVSVVINKIDRLILELKLPPQDAYYKLVHTLEEVNNIIATNTSIHAEEVLRVSPELGNVCFASSMHGWSFTLPSFAEIYASTSKQLDSGELATRLWGDWYFDEEGRRFTSDKAAAGGAPRTFVQFVLEPIYKIYSHVLSEDPEDLVPFLKTLNIKLRHQELHLDPKPLLRTVLRKFFGPPRGFVTMVVDHAPSAAEGAAEKVRLNYTGDLTSPLAVAMMRSDPEGPLMVNVVKQYNTPDGAQFLALGRVMSGVLRVGKQVKVLGESYSEDDDEDMAIVEVTSLSIPGARFSIDIDKATPGNWVLIGGVDAPIKKTATITGTDVHEVAIFRPLVFNTVPVMKVAVEPLNPSELPKMVEALRRVNKTYPIVVTKVEESGEHVIIGTGELYLDCIMHDLRHLFSDIEVKISDPVVTFTETVVETSAMACYSDTPNKKNRLTMIAEPVISLCFLLCGLAAIVELLLMTLRCCSDGVQLEDGLAEDIEQGVVDINWDNRTIGAFFQEKYNWDLLSAR